ncbi:MAG: FlgD immunoglobulin-like domain containing protein [bacterium]
MPPRSVSFMRICTSLLVVLAVAGNFVATDPAHACDPNSAKALCTQELSQRVKTTPIGVESDCGIGIVGVAGTAMFFYQMIQFDPACADYMANALDWVVGEAVEVYGNDTMPGNRLKHDWVEDKRWYLHTNAAMICGVLADGHSVFPDRGYDLVIEETLMWLAAEAYEFEAGVIHFMEPDMHTPINQSMSEGLTGVGHFCLRIKEMMPGTGAGNLGLTIANVVASTLGALAVDDPATGGLKWPLAYSCGGAHGATVPQWCGGGAGHADFLIRLYHMTGNPAHRDLAESALTYIQGVVPDMIVNEEIGLGWGSGVSGIASVFVKAFQEFGDPNYLAFAEEMANFILTQAIDTPAGQKYYDDNMHCQHGNLGVMHALDDVASESMNLRYRDYLVRLIDYLEWAQVLSQYGRVLPAVEGGNWTATGQGWGQASLLASLFGEPDVLAGNSTFISICENFRDFLLATRIEEPTGWKWPMNISYAVGTGMTHMEEVEVGLPRISIAASPNPADPAGGKTIQFYVTPQRDSQLSLKIYDIRGQLVRTLANQEPVSAPRTFEWNGQDNTGQRVASGVYFYEIADRGNSARKKLVLTR